MTWMLDPNACIRYLNGRAPVLRQKLDAIDPMQLVVCSVVKAELYYGAALSRNPAAARSIQDSFVSRFVSLSFDDKAAETYSTIRADLTKRGELIGPNDLMIAAICLANDITLISHNVAEFNRIVPLRVEDWES